MKTLQDLFLDQLADVYYAEKQLIKALPKMVKTTAHEELSAAIESHFHDTEDHVRIVEEVFKALDQTPRAKKCEAIVGILKEADEMVEEHKDCPSMDAAIIAAAQKVEHYEIATYGCLVEWAKQLRMPAVAELLDEILDQEKAADTGLTTLARGMINASASGDAGDAGEDGEDDVEERVITPSVKRPARGQTAARRN